MATERAPEGQQAPNLDPRGPNFPIRRKNDEKSTKIENLEGSPGASGEPLGASGGPGKPLRSSENLRKPAKAFGVRTPRTASPPTLQFFCHVGTQRSGPFPRDQFFVLGRFLTLPGPGEGPRRPKMMGTCSTTATMIRRGRREEEEEEVEDPPPPPSPSPSYLW